MGHSSVFPAAREVEATSAPGVRTATATWAIGVVALTFVEAIYRLGVLALETIAGGLRPLEWLALVASLGLFSYGEGHRALQKRFVPAVVTRALEPGWRRGGLVTTLLAPFHSLGLVSVPYREAARAWLGVALIVGAVFAVRALPTPWRGIVDAGVAAALTWGLVSLLGRYAEARRLAISTGTAS